MSEIPCIDTESRHAFLHRRQGVQVLLEIEDTHRP